jgi:RimJ/RimL family protein N-acetyltransferase
MQPLALQGRFVRLEPLGAHHADALARAALDPELWRITATRLTNDADVRDYIETALREQRAGTALPFATILRETGALVGSTRLANYDAANRRVEIGWTWIARPWQRTAVNTEAKYLMLQHAFETLGCIRVELKTDLLNEQSQRAIERLGAMREGVLRSHMIVHDGRRRDTVYYSILDREWPRVKKALAARLDAPPGLRS